MNRIIFRAYIFNAVKSLSILFDFEMKCLKRSKLLTAFIVFLSCRKEQYMSFLYFKFHFQYFMKQINSKNVLPYTWYSLQIDDIQNTIQVGMRRINNLAHKLLLLLISTHTKWSRWLIHLLTILLARGT